MLICQIVAFRFNYLSIDKKLKFIYKMECGHLILIPKVDNVVLIDKSDGNNKSLEGTLCISSYNLILSSRQDDEQELWVRF